MKFHVNTLHSFKVILWLKFKNEKNKGQKLQKYDA